MDMITEFVEKYGLLILTFSFVVWLITLRLFPDDESKELT